MGLESKAEPTLMCCFRYYDTRRKMATAVWADDGLYGGESSQTFQAQIGRARYAQLVQGHEETDSKGQMSSRTAREVRPSDGGCWQISQSESIWINKNMTMKKIKFWRGHTVTGTRWQAHCYRYRPSVRSSSQKEPSLLCNFQSKTKTERRYEGDVTSESSSRP